MDGMEQTQWTRTVGRFLKTSKDVCRPLWMRNPSQVDIEASSCLGDLAKEDRLLVDGRIRFARTLMTVHTRERSARGGRNLKTPLPPKNATL